MVVVAGVVPLVGQLYPKLVPFLIAYRPYAGNWRFSWHIVDNKATHKLRKLKCVNEWMNGWSLCLPQLRQARRRHKRPMARLARASR